MALRYPVVLVLGVLLGSLIGAVAWWLRDRHRRPQALPLAHLDLLTGLPEFARALWRHRFRTGALAVGTGVVGLVALLGAARPIALSVVTPERTNRDVVVCLDVSGSMNNTDQAVLATFRRAADAFKGERMSLVIFNSTAVPVFPLTDDYPYIGDQLITAQKALTGAIDPSFLAGTLGGGSGSSLIGDGLVSCLHGFDHAEAHRARSVVLATDNLAAGKSLFTLEEAAALAREDDVQVYAVNPADRSDSSASQQLKAVAESTGGQYFPLDRPDAVSRIAASIADRESGRIPGGAVLLAYDTPSGLVVTLIVGVLALLLARRWWRS